MLRWSELSRRRLTAELMDDPALDPQSHRDALAGLRRVNRASNSAAILWRPIARWVRARGATSVRVLDIASGGGDVAVALAWRAARAGLRLEVLGLDRSPVAVDTVRSLAERELAGIARRSGGAERATPRLEFAVADVLTEALPGGFQIVTSSLFLHHLREEAATKLLSRMASAAGDLMLVNDLHRSAGGYLLAQLACRLLTRSPIVRADGPASVAAAFTAVEAGQLCAAAGLHAVTIQRVWPSRMLISWARGGHETIG